MGSPRSSARDAGLKPSRVSRVVGGFAAAGGWTAAVVGLAVAGCVALAARRPEFDLVAQFAAPALWVVLLMFVLALAARAPRAAGAVLTAAIALTLALYPQLFARPAEPPTE